MDMRTGKIYDSKEEALSDGVPASDIAEIIRHDESVPEVRFASGPFKNRIYKRTPDGNLVRVK